MVSRLLGLACVVLSASVFACGVAGDDPGADGRDEDTADDALVDGAPLALTIGADNASLEIRDDRSLMVTDPRGFSRVEGAYSFGRVLGSFADFVMNDLAPKGKARYDRRGDFIAHAFDDAADELDDHGAAKAPITKLGIVDTNNPWRKIVNQWPELARNDVGRGPFRLLAVVNRLDLAGDLDFRATVDAGSEPKAMGEGRLVFGFVDPQQEKNGKAAPTTMIVEFRLPALGAELNVIRDFDYRAAAADPAVYREQLQRWGQVWRELSRWTPDERAFQDHLLAIVQRFAKPENFIGIRGNALVKNDKDAEEMELREWYVLRQSWTLIRRKPRDEPYRCIARGKEMREVVDQFWVPERNDVNMVTPPNPNQETSYNVPRAVRLPAKRYEGCFDDPKTDRVPYGMEVEGQFADGRRMFLANFGRTKDGEVWPLAGAPEEKRHAFAMRTCTGCHSAEAGLRGRDFAFHVRPRLAGEASKLSPFLTGGATFASDGVRYEYSELRKRAAYVKRAADRDPTLQMADGLWRDDRKK